MKNTSKLMAMALTATTMMTALTTTAVPFSDSFNGPSIDPDWVTDRYEPNEFVVENFLGDDRLKIGISIAQSDFNRGGQSSVFYNTHGRQHASQINSAWTMSADLYISGDMIDGDSLRRTDLWARTSSDGAEANAYYPIFGMAQFDPADPFNSAAANIAPVWRVWDADGGVWAILADAVTAGWHNLMISGSGTTLSYHLDGSLVHTDNIGVSVENLTTTFLQAYNFNQTSSADGNYSVYWDNVNVSAAAVPEAGTSLALLGIAAMVVGGLRRRLK